MNMRNEHKEANPRCYYIYLTKSEFIPLENVDKIFLDVGGNATIFSQGICIAAFPSKGYLYIICKKDDVIPETITDDETQIVYRKVK
jgi:hypothetical protein